MFSYFTDEEAKRNRLSVSGDLDIELLEPSWDEERAQAMKPGQTVPKDPTVRNRSETAAGWVFVDIVVPRAEVVVFDEETGAIEGPAERDLFVFDAEGSGWTPMKSFVAQLEDRHASVYRFAWPQVLEAGETTAPIFESITLVNLVNDQGQAGRHVVGAIGRGIQGVGFPTPEEAWEALGVVDEEYEAPKLVDALTVAAADGTTSLILVPQGAGHSTGEEFEGGTIAEVVSDAEAAVTADGKTPLVSAENRAKVSLVDVRTPVAPEDPSRWFSGLSSAVEFNLGDMAAEGQVEGLFEGCSKAKTVRTSEATALTCDLPGGRWTGGSEVVAGGETLELERSTTYVNEDLSLTSVPYCALYGSTSDLTLVIGMADISSESASAVYADTSTRLGSDRWGAVYQKQLNIAVYPSEQSESGDRGQRWLVKHIPARHEGKSLLNDAARGLGACCSLMYGSEAGLLGVGSQEEGASSSFKVTKVVALPGTVLRMRHAAGGGRYAYQGDGRDLSYWPTFPECAEADLSQATVHHAQSAYGWFENWSKLRAAKLPAFAGDCVFASTRRMFANTALATTDVSGLPMAADANMAEMFLNCKSLTSVGPSVPVATAQIVSCMFYKCSSLALDATGWEWPDKLGNSPNPPMFMGDVASQNCPCLGFNYQAPGGRARLAGGEDAQRPDARIVAELGFGAGRRPGGRSVARVRFGRRFPMGENLSAAGRRAAAGAIALCVAVALSVAAVLGCAGYAFASGGSWRSSGSGWWYAYDGGGFASSGWERIDGRWHLFDDDGWMEAGWALVGGEWYYLDDSGAMAEGWRRVGGEWYYLSPASGEMVVGWLLANGTWYYLEPSGAMAEEWVRDGFAWYYLEPGSGAMAADRWVGDCYVGPDGAWVPGVPLALEAETRPHVHSLAFRTVYQNLAPKSFRLPYELRSSGCRVFVFAADAEGNRVGDVLCGYAANRASLMAQAKAQMPEGGQVVLAERAVSQLRLHPTVQPGAGTEIYCTECGEVVSSTCWWR